MALYLLFAALLLGALFLPRLWVERVMRRYRDGRYAYPCSGGETARRLLDRYGMGHIAVESTPEGDHYDPRLRAVRLNARNYQERSLTAVAVAAHEVGHAVQHEGGYAPLMWRIRLLAWSGGIERLGALVLVGAPFLALLTRRPLPALALFLAGLAALGVPAAIHLLTLPVEFDASFARALPMLRGSGALRAGDERAARRVLRAAALTYLASALGGLFNIWRWLRALRR